MPMHCNSYSLGNSVGSRVRLLTTLSTRQKTHRKQTQSLQRRERALSANFGTERGLIIRSMVVFLTLQTAHETAGVFVRTPAHPNRSE